MTLVAGLVLLFAVSNASTAWSQVFESRAPRAFLYDVNTRTVLYAQREDDVFHPSSMSKLVTTAVVFDLLSEGDLSQDTLFEISEDAWRRGGGPSGRAAMFAELGSDVAVIDLLRGLIVMAANDGALALAEGAAGSEGAFSGLMTQTASELGATNSSFTNATGATDTVNQTTVRDLVQIADRLIADHSDLYALFALPDFTWNDIFQRNRNPIFGEIDGADGLFAGFNEDAGYGLVGSVVRDGRRVVFALSGMDTLEGRVDEAQRLVRYAFEDFQTVHVADPGEPIAFARVYGGATREVGLVAPDGALELLLPHEGVDRVRARVQYEHPMPTPIARGDVVARLLVERDGTIIQDRPLVASNDVERGSMMQRARDGFFEVLLGWLPPISFAGDF
ncbi:MAG: D-alanyl-D-alanine carboxypeptidase family protein [Pseudomonadota bacterium]